MNATDCSTTTLRPDRALGASMNVRSLFVGLSAAPGAEALEALRLALAALPCRRLFVLLPEGTVPGGLASVLSAAWPSGRSPRVQMVGGTAPDEVVHRAADGRRLAVGTQRPLAWLLGLDGVDARIHADGPPRLGRSLLGRPSACPGQWIEDRTLLVEHLDGDLELWTPAMLPGGSVLAPVSVSGPSCRAAPGWQAPQAVFVSH